MRRIAVGLLLLCLMMGFAVRAEDTAPRHLTGAEALEIAREHVAQNSFFTRKEVDAMRYSGRLTTLSDMHTDNNALLPYQYYQSKEGVLLWRIFLSYDDTQAFVYYVDIALYTGEVLWDNCEKYRQEDFERYQDYRTLMTPVWRAAAQMEKTWGPFALWDYANRAAFRKLYGHMPDETLDVAMNDSTQVYELPRPGTDSPYAAALNVAKKAMLDERGVPVEVFDEIFTVSSAFYYVDEDRGHWKFYLYTNEDLQAKSPEYSAIVHITPLALSDGVFVASNLGMYIRPTSSVDTVQKAVAVAKKWVEDNILYELRGYPLEDMEVTATRMLFADNYITERTLFTQYVPGPDDGWSYRAVWNVRFNFPGEEAPYIDIIINLYSGEVQWGSFEEWVEERPVDETLITEEKAIALAAACFEEQQLYFEPTYAAVNYTVKTSFYGYAKDWDVSFCRADGTGVTVRVNQETGAASWIP